MELTKDNFREIYLNAASALKSVSRNRTASHTRIAIWNGFFPDSPISLQTSLRHRFTTSLHQYLSGGPTDRFCFELSVLFLDLPVPFFNLTSSFPAPLSIAMRNAYKVVNEHLEKPNIDSITKLIQTILATLPHEKLPAFKAILQSILYDKSETNKYMKLLKQILDPICFDAFLEAMPPTLRLRYALIYDRSPPRIFIDYKNLSMPIEFLQAICENDGKEEVRKLLNNQNIQDVIIEEDYESEQDDTDFEDISPEVSENEEIKEEIDSVVQNEEEDL